MGRGASVIHPTRKVRLRAQTGSIERSGPAEVSAHAARFGCLNRITKDIP